MNGRQAAARAKRQRKPDRLLNPDATAAEIASDLACAPFDGMVRAMDKKWGIDRLPELVSFETAQKYGLAVASLTEAIQNGDTQVTRNNAENCARGLKAMDAEAEAAGHPKADVRVWEVRVGDRILGFVADSGAWQAVSDARPDLDIVPLERAVGAILRDEKNLRQIQNPPPMSAPRPPTELERELDDEIPF